MDKKEIVRTRFAPSPTGYLHIGGLRSALFDYAYAKSLGGKFILRIEDTDRTRYVEGAMEKLLKILKIFGIVWDEGPQIGGQYEPYIQSERLKSGIYKKRAEELVEGNHAYYCFCKAQTKEEISKSHIGKNIELRDPCRNILLGEAKRRIECGEVASIRLRVPDSGSISFYDEVLKKEISWELGDVDEAMLLKSDGFPTYHLAVVVDDVTMKISHIIRGFEWLPSTPIHLLLFKYFKYDLPKIGHFPLILDPDGGKLSKRKRNVSCEEFIKLGYLPEAILNYIMLLGWAPKDNREIFSLSEYVLEFQNGNIQIANAVFNQDKLDWMNQQYIQNLSDKILADKLLEYAPEDGDRALMEKISPLVKSRLKKLSEFTDLAGFFFQKPEIDKNLLGKNAGKHLESAKKVLLEISNWTLKLVNDELLEEVRRCGYKTGDFFMDLRIAITGKKFTPPINESIVILGREETLARINKSLNL